MKRIVQLAASAALLAGISTTAAAQDTMDQGPFLKPPVFAILPSFLTTNVISAPEGVDSHTGFNARFQAVIPTSSPWLAFVGGAQWGPLSDEDHGAIIFLGGIIPIAPISNATGGALGISLDPLLVATGPGSDGMDFVGEVAVVLNIGSMMMKNGGFWSGMGLFFLLDQNLTPDDVTIPNPTGPGTTTIEADRFNPVLIYGVALPLAPWPGSK